MIGLFYNTLLMLYVMFLMYSTLCGLFSQGRERAHANNDIKLCDRASMTYVSTLAVYFVM